MKILIIGSPHLKSRRFSEYEWTQKHLSFSVLLGYSSGLEFYCAGLREFHILWFSDLWGMRCNSQEKKKVPKGDSERKSEFFLCRWIPLPSSSSFWVWKGLVFLLDVPPRDTTSWSERGKKGQYRESLGLLWLTLANICSVLLLWMLPLWDVQNSKIPKYVKGSLHFWLFCLFLAEFCSGSIVRISTLPGNLLYFWAPFFFFPFDCRIDWILWHFLKKTWFILRTVSNYRSNPKYITQRISHYPISEWIIRLNMPI